MKKKILIGSIIAVVILTLVSFSSVVGYSSMKSNPSNTIITDEYDSYTPIQLVLQLTSKLRNHPNIQSVETEDDVLQIIEGDEELNSIFEQISGNDCDCEDDTTPFLWPFPIICFVFGFPLILLALLAWAGGQSWVGDMVWVFGAVLNCFWY
jgi:hypothetical protein